MKLLVLTLLLLAFVATADATFDFMRGKNVGNKNKKHHKNKQISNDKKDKQDKKDKTDKSEKKDKKDKKDKGKKNKNNGKKPRFGKTIENGVVNFWKKWVKHVFHWRTWTKANGVDCTLECGTTLPSKRFSMNEGERACDVCFCTPKGKLLCKTVIDAGCCVAAPCPAEETDAPSTDAPSTLPPRDPCLDADCSVGTTCVVNEQNEASCVFVCSTREVFSPAKDVYCCATEGICRDICGEQSLICEGGSKCAVSTYPEAVCVVDCLSDHPKTAAVEKHCCDNEAICSNQCNKYSTKTARCQELSGVECYYNYGDCTCGDFAINNCLVSPCDNTVCADGYHCREDYCGACNARCVVDGWCDSDAECGATMYCRQGVNELGRCDGVSRCYPKQTTGMTCGGSKSVTACGRTMCLEGSCSSTGKTPGTCMAV